MSIDAPAATNLMVKIPYRPAKTFVPARAMTRLKKGTLAAIGALPVPWGENDIG